jgi:hypothetical protein
MPSKCPLEQTSGGFLDTDFFFFVIPVSVESQKSYKTVGDAARQAQNATTSEASESAKPIKLVELLKPHGQTQALFTALQL